MTGVVVDDSDRYSEGHNEKCGGKGQWQVWWWMSDKYSEGHSEKCGSKGVTDMVKGSDSYGGRGTVRAIVRVDSERCGWGRQ